MSLDREWRFAYVNQTMARWLKRSRADLDGRGIWECCPDLIGSAYYRTFHEAAASGASCTCTAYYAPLACWFEARAFPDANGLTVLFRDVSRERQQSAQLEYHADHDYLTGLPNRRRCTQVLARAVAQVAEQAAQAQVTVLPADTEAQAPQVPQAAGVVVLFVDLDRFKEVNDAFGHAVGDTLLCKVAERFRALLAPSAFVARVGGDEFVFILRDTRPGQAERFAGAILAGVSQPFQVDGHTLLLGASVGIAQWPEAGDTADTLLNHADAAMYAAKAAGVSSSASSTWTLPKACGSACSCAPTCMPRWPTTSWCCTSSRNGRCRMAGWRAQRRCCAGSTQRAACCLPPPFSMCCWSRRWSRRWGCGSCAPCAAR